jgi:hypothetical protein
VSHFRAFAAFWQDFLLGDDWRLTAGAVSSLALAFVLELIGLHAWWLPPCAVALLLAASLRRVTRRGG